MLALVVLCASGRVLAAPDDQPAAAPASPETPATPPASSPAAAPVLAPTAQSVVAPPTPLAAGVVSAPDAATPPPPGPSTPCTPCTAREESSAEGILGPDGGGPAGVQTHFNGGFGMLDVGLAPVHTSNVLFTVLAGIGGYGFDFEISIPARAPASMTCSRTPSTAPRSGEAES